MHCSFPDVSVFLEKLRNTHFCDFEFIHQLLSCKNYTRMKHTTSCTIYDPIGIRYGILVSKRWNQELLRIRLHLKKPEVLLYMSIKLNYTYKRPASVIYEKHPHNVAVVFRAVPKGRHWRFFFWDWGIAIGLNKTQEKISSSAEEKLKVSMIREKEGATPNHSPIGTSLLVSEF